jgi:hypothetical protein
MTTIARPRIQIIHDGSVPVGVDTQSEIVPNGESWQIQRITFGDMSRNDTKSGIFRVDFGVDGDRDILAIAYLTSTTIIIPIKRVFLGDGIKEFRFIRESQSSPDKNMLIFTEGFKRIGDIGV